MQSAPIAASTPPAPLNPGDLVDEREAAAILGAQVQTLRNWRWKRVGPRYRKIGKRLVRYYKPDLLAFVAGGTGEVS